MKRLCRIVLTNVFPGPERLGPRTVTVDVEGLKSFSFIAPSHLTDHDTDYFRQRNQPHALTSGTPSLADMESPFNHASITFRSSFNHLLITVGVTG
jgi:hypothetical protein